MTFDRAVLALSAAFVLVSGAACVVAPGSFAVHAGLSAAPHVLTEIRAFHGGLLIGIGCFLVWCLRQRTLNRAGLLLVAFSVGGAGMARTLGLLVDRAPTAFHLTNLAVEVTTVVAATVAVARSSPQSE